MKFIIEQSDEMLTTHPGLALVGLLLKKTDIKDRLNQLKIDGIISPEISNRDIVTSYIGLLCQGKSCYDHIKPFREDIFFCKSLDMKSVPSSSTLRQRLQRMGVTTETEKVILEESIKLIKTVNAPLTPIVLPAIKDNEQTIVFPERHLIPCDADVSCMDNSKTKKEGVSRTYHGYDGFSPMFAYIGLEGYTLNGELRDGKTHCQNGTPDFLAESIRLARLITDNPLLFRLDSGNDSIDNILKFTNREDYIIKRNLRKESPEKWLDIAKQQVEDKTGTCIKAREGKKVYYGRTSINRKESTEPLSVAYKVTERTIKANGQILLIPEIEADTYWTSLPDSAETIVHLYEEHGTSEQFHSEIKSDMDLERLPSNNFDCNDLVLRIGLFAYNILRIVGQISLMVDDRGPVKVSRRRLKTVIQNLIYLASRLVSHARYYKLRFGAYCPWFEIYRKIYVALE